MKNILINFKKEKASGLVLDQKTLFAPLTYLFNLCLKTGSFQKLFNDAIVKPMFKRGDKNNLTNYRPKVFS